MEALADHPQRFNWPTVHRIASQVRPDSFLVRDWCLSMVLFVLW